MRQAWLAPAVWRKKTPDIRLSIVSFTTHPEPMFHLNNGESITPEVFDSTFGW